MKSARGFTLIELLVVITLIAIISSIGMVMYQEGQKAARDTKRKQDLRSIQTALTIYYQKNNRYPCSDDNLLDSSGNARWQTSTSAAPWLIDSSSVCPSLTTVLFDNNYINNLPTDPKNIGGGLPWSSSSNYSYAYWSGQISSYFTNCPQSKAQYYILATKLENANDPEVSSKMSYYFCNGTTITSISQLISGSSTSELFFVTSQD